MTSLVAITLMLACGNATNCVEFPTMDGGITKVQTEVLMTIQEQDLTEFHLVMDQYDRPALSMALASEAQSQLAKITTDHVGQSLALIVDGKVVSEPRIVSPITQGRIQLTPGANSTQPFWEKVPWMEKKLGISAEDHRETARRNSVIYVIVAAVLIAGAAVYLLMGNGRRRKNA